jgi:uroporphyrinogen decarboxylase
MDDHLIIPGLTHLRAKPDWESAKKALLRQAAPERPPRMELFQDPEVHEAVLGRPVLTFADLAEVQLRLGYDTVQLRVSPAFQRAMRHTDDTANLSRGDRDWHLAGDGMIRTWQDFETYPWPEVDPALPEYLEQAGKVLPDGMAILFRTSGVFENTVRLMGYEGVCMALCETPDLLRAVTDRVGALLHDTFVAGLACDRVDGLFYGDDMGFKTATMVPPDYLRDAVIPWHRRNAEAAHAKGGIVILHSCGCVEAIMDDLIDAGIDAKHSFEDVIEPVASFKRRHGDKLGVVGGVDMDLLTRGSAGEVRARTRAVMEACAPGGGFAVGSGNSIANYVPLGNYFAMLREAFAFG